MVITPKRFIPAPHPGVVQRRPAPGAVIQRYQGGLMKQSGPSCWIFVVEAVADIYSAHAPAHASFNSGLLAAVINLYPRHDVGDRRTLELRDIQTRITAMILQFTRMKPGSTHVGRDDIAKVVARQVDRFKSPRVDDFMRICFPNAGYYNIDEVNNLLRRAAGLAGELADLVRDDPGDDAEGALLGSRGKSHINKTDWDSDIAGSLEANLQHPAATVGVRKRLKPRNYPQHYNAGTDTYDLTTVHKSDITEGGYHALLLVSVDRAAKTLIYKDPNYGNSKIKITFVHLRKMAESMEAENAGKGVEVQMFTGLDSGVAQMPGVLRRWGTIPIFTVLKAAPPRVLPVRVAPVHAAPIHAPVHHVAPVHAPVLPGPVHAVGGPVGGVVGGPPPVPWYQTSVGRGVGVVATAAVIGLGYLATQMKPAPAGPFFRVPPMPPKRPGSR